MALAVGTRLGPYEVVGPLGAGGMGEVYRATDTNLKRQVALKVLPASVAGDAERLARFQREAEVLAALNHPHIAQIHGIERAEGQTALVMELVEGEDLSQRIARGALPLDEALTVARQMAEALEAAHEQGIIHRDLKPANIKVRADGTVKVLDFGLAKAIEPSAGVRGLETLTALANSPTLASPAATGVGIILGTAAYMSPEQAKGLAATKRSDIWAFGCILYEMLTGRRAFEGEGVTDTLASVLKGDVDWARLPAGTPLHVSRVLRRCLARDRRHRLADIADAALDLADGESVPSSPGTSFWNTTRFPPLAWLLIGTALVIGAAVGVAGLAPRAVVSPTGAVTRFSIPLPAGARLADDQPAIALSPDGRTAVVAADDGTGARLYVRALDGLTMTALNGTTQSRMPFFSPDGQWVGFFSQGKLRKIALSGGAPQEISDASEPYPAAWSDDGFIFFTQTSGGGLSRVPVTGGEPQIVTTPNPDKREKTHINPWLLPGGRAMLVTVGNADISSFDDADIDVLTLATGQRKTVVKGGMDARYVATGHILYARAGSLLAVPFDLDRLEVTGPPSIVASDVMTDAMIGAAAYAVSRDGSLFYAPGGVKTYESQLVWMDRAGRSEPLTDLRRAFTGAHLSPDGGRVAMEILAANNQLWIHDIARATTSRVTSGWDNMNGIWSPDGEHVTFQSNRETSGAYSIFSQATDGAGSSERLPMDADPFQYPTSWTPDGQHLLFRTNHASAAGLWIWSVMERKARSYLRDAANGRVSPDGRWIAYQSSERGGQPEVFVRQFPGPSRRWTVSTGGGALPLWARDGRELDHLAADWLMAVRIENRPAFSVGTPQRLFKKPNGPPFYRTTHYDVAADGRFLMIRHEPQNISQVNVVLNWFEELRPGR